MPSEENNASDTQAAGEARVHLPLSESQISGGSLDLLYPLYEDDKRLLFNQLGLRRSDNRNILNLGLGQRHYGAGWLAGYNAFYDAQISGSPHQRLGLGVEYRRDYLHLAVNGYYGLTGWRTAHTMSGRDERVAHGYDIRAQGWLPALPQLSGKLKFEHYFGEDVAFGKHASRGRNPYALTLGIGYTPVPLITFGLDNIFYRHGGSNTTFGLSLNYQLGVPLSQQLDPGNVSAKGKVADSRYRLVERNNHIVLDYRQTSQQPEFALPPTMEGYPGETKLLKYTFRSAFKLKSIQWDDHALRAMGGNIRQLGEHAYAVHFPDYQPAGSNQMIISAVANDEHGNTSNRSEITVSVLPLEQAAQFVSNGDVPWVPEEPTKSGGTGESLNPEVEGESPKPEGEGESPKPEGEGESPKSGGEGESPKSGGEGESPKSKGEAESPKSEGEEVPTPPTPPKVEEKREEILVKIRSKADEFDRIRKAKEEEAAKKAKEAKEAKRIEREERRKLREQMIQREETLSDRQKLEARRDDLEHSSSSSEDETADNESEWKPEDDIS